jgi:RNA polymerase sigma factor (sigma-70 family)
VRFGLAVGQTAMQPDEAKDPMNMERTRDSKTCYTTARDDRIKAHLDLVTSIAGDIRGRPLGRGMELEDLVAYGGIGLVEAATRFEERDVPFAAFARHRIHGAILDGIRTQHWFGRRAERHLRIDRVGHDWEVALRAGDRVRNDVRWNGRPIVCPSSDTADVNERIAVALRGLPVLERRVVDFRYFQGKTLSQAAKEMGFCRPWVSKVHARALATLRAAIEKSILYRQGDARENDSATPCRLRNWSNAR